MKVTRLELVNQGAYFSQRLDPTSVLRKLIGNTTIFLGRGAKHSLQKQRKAFNIWKVIGGEVFNLSGNINESKGKGITIVLFQRGKNSISFEGIPLVLEPKIKYGEERFDRSNIPIEEKLESTGVVGEFKVTFLRLDHDCYKLRVGDPNLDIYGNLRK